MTQQLLDSVKSKYGAVAESGVNDRFEAGSATNHCLQRDFGSIGHDDGVDLVAALQQTEDDGFAAGTPAAPPAHALWAEVGLVGFEHPFQGGLTFALGGDLGAQTKKKLCSRNEAKRRSDGPSEWLSNPMQNTGPKDGTLPRITLKIKSNDLTVPLLHSTAIRQPFAS